MWQLRQKVGDMLVLTPTVDTIVEKDGKILLVQNIDKDYAWGLPAGIVEPGRSWAENAIKELEEEAMLTARPGDLTPIMTVSGGGYIFQYPDGTTQPFTLVFRTEKVTPIDAPLDKSEISAVSWFTPEEALKLPLTISAARILPAYQEYKQTGVFQQIVFSQET